MFVTFFYFQIQIIAYNTDIYGNMTQAVYSSHGLAILGILFNVSHIVTFKPFNSLTAGPEYIWVFYFY